MIEKKSINIKGGARQGSGRKPGSPNRKTAEVQRKVEDTGITPLQFMIEVMRDEGREPRERLNAAISAAPYVHPKLSSIEHSGANGADLLPTVINIVSGKSA